jgi:hypothetical protein
MLRRCMQARNTEPRVNHEIPIASPHVPDVTLLQPDDMRLPNKRDVIGNPFEIEPASGYCKTHDQAPFDSSEC